MLLIMLLIKSIISLANVPSYYHLPSALPRNNILRKYFYGITFKKGLTTPILCSLRTMITLSPTFGKDISDSVQAADILGWCLNALLLAPVRVCSIY
jgi:hypothetical protein